MRNLPTDKTWIKYGKKEPYFAVFGQKEFLNKNLQDKDVDYFFSSGSAYVDELFTIIQDKIDSDFRANKILDFGCGPGRMLIPFSRYAKEVYGIDISSDMLTEAKKNCVKFGVKNSYFFLADKQLKCIANDTFNLVHSYIVFQHLNRKRGEKYLQLLLDKITNGGIGVFHFTYADNFVYRGILNFFRFKIPYFYVLQRAIGYIFLNRYFHTCPQMQMNNYNLNRIYSVLQKNNITEIYSVLTDHHNYWGVNLYFKKDGKQRYKLG
jgi:SAM-dependent methyltransferase